MTFPSTHKLPRKTTSVNVELRSDNPKWALRKFLSVPKSTVKRVAWVGDSTVSQPFVTTYSGAHHYIDSGLNTGSYVDDFFGKVPSDPFYNCHHYNFALNGQKLENFVNHLTTGATVADIAAVDPHLIVFCYLINDVRRGERNEAQCKADLSSAMAMLLEQCPNASIILRMPNSLGYDSTNANDYINPPVTRVKVQGYSDILRNAYRNVSKPDHVYLWDTQRGEYQVFNEYVETTSPGTDLINGDALHPANNGYLLMFKVLAAIIAGDNRHKNTRLDYPTWGFDKPICTVQSNRCNTRFGTSDYKSYPLIVNDPKYFNVLMVGAYGGTSIGTNTIINQNGPIKPKDLVGIFATGDIVCQMGVNATTDGPNGEHVIDGDTAWEVLAGKNESGDNLQFYGQQTNIMRDQPINGRIVIARRRPSTQKHDYDPDFTEVLAQANFAAGTLSRVAQRFGVVSAISGVSATAPTTGGTIDLKKNGTTFATLTWANNATTATISGTFAGANTKGMYFNEGDFIEAVVNSGFVGGTYPKITLSNR